jgi:TolB-like protein
MAIADFALKLGLVLKTFNLSRGRLAQTVGVDKSVVSRWASGVQVPSDHNLSLLTEAVAHRRPGFERLDWDLDAEGFATKLDVRDAGASRLALPDKPSIAVLPFQNMSGDPEQEYFTDGITEDIITELSRFHSLFVIARNSSFSYKGKSPDIQQVGRDLGVRYVLEGSIRKSSNRIRVTGELVDTFTGNHLWAERYDRVLEDIFAVQEEVTQSIVAVIAPQIESTEQSKAARRRPDNLSAYEIGLLAWAHAWQGYAAADRTLLDQAMREARDALAIDPRSALALPTLPLLAESRCFF